MAVHCPKSLLTRFYKALTEFQLRLQLFMYSNFMVSADIIFSLINQRKTNVTNRTVLFMLIVNYVSKAFVNEKKIAFGYLDWSFPFFWPLRSCFCFCIYFIFLILFDTSDSLRTADLIWKNFKGFERKICLLNR